MNNLKTLATFFAVSFLAPLDQVRISACKPLAFSTAAAQPLTRPLPSEGVARVLDSRMSLIERQLSWDALLRLPLGERLEGLRAIVASSDPMFSGSAAIQLIQARDQSGCALISDLMPGWQPQNQVVVLQALPMFGDHILHRAIAHRALEASLSLSCPDTADFLPASPADLAAIYLVRNGEKNDPELFRRALAANAQSASIWLAAGKVGAIGDLERETALRNYSDPTKGIVLRVASALALPSDSKASDFARKTLAEFVSSFRDWDVLSEPAAVIPGASDDRTLGSFMAQVRLLAMLQYMQDDDAQEIVLGSLHAKNPVVRDTAQLIAAGRWPTRLLSIEETLPRRRRGDLILAFLALSHPDLDSRAERVAAGGLSDAKRRLQTEPLHAVCGLAGGIVAGH